MATTDFILSLWTSNTSLTNLFYGSKSPNPYGLDHNKPNLNLEKRLPYHIEDSPDLKSIEYDAIEIQSRSMSDPTPSDNDFSNQMALVWTTLKNSNFFLIHIRTFYLENFSPPRHFSPPTLNRKCVG